MADILHFAGAAMAEDRMPQDRMPEILASDLTPAQRKAADAFVAVRKMPVFGPFVPLLRSPELMGAARSMGDYLRFRSALPPKISELVILITAREWTQEVEWQIHRPMALAAGLDPAIVAAVKDGREPRGMADDEAAAYAFATELQRDRAVSRPTYDRAVGLFGEEGVVDLAGVCGYYTFLAMVMNMAATPLPRGAKPALRQLRPADRRPAPDRVVPSTATPRPRLRASALDRA